MMMPIATADHINCVPVGSAKKALSEDAGLVRNLTPFVARVSLALVTGRLPL